MKYCSDDALSSQEPLNATTFQCNGILLIPFSKRCWGNRAERSFALKGKKERDLLQKLNDLGVSVKFYNPKSEADEFLYYDTDESGHLYNEVQKIVYSCAKHLRYPQSLDDRMRAFVCTHGQRDACCAKYGYGIVCELRKEFGELEVFEVSHLGGDRFAASVLCFPSGDMFGHLRPGNVVQCLRAVAQGNIDPHLWRGNIFRDEMSNLVSSAILKTIHDVGCVNISYHSIDEHYSGITCIGRAETRLSNGNGKIIDFSISFQLREWTSRSSCKAVERNFKRTHFVPELNSMSILEQVI